MDHKATSRTQHTIYNKDEDRRVEWKFASMFLSGWGHSESKVKSDPVWRSSTPQVANCNKDR